MKRGELDQFEVIFTGAGASVAWPSRLPSGAKLGTTAVDAFIQAMDPTSRSALGDLTAVKEAITSPNGIDADGIRLEQLMEELGNVSAGRPLVEVYDLLASDAPNVLHLLIAKTKLPVVTVNIDGLHEQAAADVAAADGDPARNPPPVIHLHGTVGDDASISTTISRYRSGLPQPVDEEFAAAIENRSVLVIGWAGRDWDIAEAFLTYPPKRMLWLEHPDPRKQPGQTPIPDAMNLMERLNRDAGRRVAVWEIADARAALADAYGGEPPLARDSSTVTAPVTKAGVPVRAVDALTRADPQDVAVGLARTLVTAGVPSVAVRLLEAHETQNGPLPTAYARVLARAQRAAGDLAGAGRTLSRPSWFRHPVARVSNLNERAALSSKRGHKRRAVARNYTVIGLAKVRGNSRHELTARVRNAQILGAAGYLRFAKKQFDVIFPNHRVPGTRLVELGIGNVVDALTWFADLCKVTGSYGQARELARDAVDLAPYGSPTQLAYALFKSAEVKLLAGEPVEVVDAELERADTAASHAADPVAAAWILCLRADAARRHGRILDLTAAEKPAEQDGLLFLYLALQRAEGHRLSGDPVGCVEQLRALRRREAGIPLGNRTALLAARFVEAESLVDAGRASDAAKLLRRLSRQYSRFGMAGAVQRVEQLRAAAAAGKAAEYRPVLM
ncbi:SIR2 family protein [Leifsonia aquatica]|uniref:SIR2 family protein n=1 Tax=Leifsonia aquatica TaxID=144185 RepID=UPI003820D84D